MYINENAEVPGYATQNFYFKAVFLWSLKVKSVQNVTL
jgi:hypothetical protein